MPMLTGKLNSLFWNPQNTSDRVIGETLKVDSPINYRTYNPILLPPQLWHSRGFSEKLIINDRLHLNELKNLVVSSNHAINTYQTKSISHFDLDITGQLLLVSFDNGLVQMYNFLANQYESINFSRRSQNLPKTKYLAPSFSVNRDSPAAVTSALWYPFDSELFVTSSLDGSLKIWETDSRKKIALYKFKTSIYAIDFCTSISKCCIVCGLEDSSIRICDLRLANTSQTLKGHTSKVLAVSWKPSNEYQIASGSEDQSISVWDIRRGNKSLFDCDKLVGIRSKDDTESSFWLQSNQSYIKHDPSILKEMDTSDFNSESDMWKYIYSHDKTHKRRHSSFTSTENNILKKHFPKHKKSDSSQDYLEEANTYMNYMKKIQRQKNPSPLVEKNQSSKNFAIPKALPDKTSTSSIIINKQSKQGVVHTELQQLRPLAHDGPVTSLQYSRDAHFIYSSGQDGVLRKWAANDGKNQWVNFGYQENLSTLTSQFSIDQTDEYLFHFHGRSWTLFHTKNGQTIDLNLKRLHAHSKPTRAIKWNPIRNELYTGSLDGSLQIWNKNWNIG